MVSVENVWLIFYGLKATMDMGVALIVRLTVGSVCVCVQGVWLLHHTPPAKRGRKTLSDTVTEAVWVCLTVCMCVSGMWVCERGEDYSSGIGSVTRNTFKGTSACWEEKKERWWFLCCFDHLVSLLSVCLWEWLITATSKLFVIKFKQFMGKNMDQDLLCNLQ